MSIVQARPRHFPLIQVSEIIVAPGFIIVYSLMKAKKQHMADSIRTRLQLVIIVKAKADCYIFAYSYIHLCIWHTLLSITLRDSLS